MTKQTHAPQTIVTSSSNTSYEIHPNTFKPIAGDSTAPVARNTIHSSATHSSVQLLPKVPLP